MIEHTLTLGARMKPSLVTFFVRYRVIAKREVTTTDCDSHVWFFSVQSMSSLTNKQRMACPDTANTCSTGRVISISGDLITNHLWLLFPLLS